jgi:hypothetical protein
MKPMLAVEDEFMRTPILAAATRLVQHADTSPRVMKLRLMRITGILAIGICLGVTVVVAIWTDVPKSDPAKALAAFLLLGAIGLVVTSGLGLLLVAWSGYVTEYVRRLEKEAEASESAEVTDQCIEMSFDAEFEQGVVLLVAEALRQKVSTVPVISLSTITSITNEPWFGQKLCDLIRRVLSRKTNNPDLMEEVNSR